jgi:hypothetical protein
MLNAEVKVEFGIHFSTQHSTFRIAGTQKRPVVSRRSAFRFNGLWSGLE